MKEVRKSRTDEIDGFANGAGNGSVETAFRKLQKNCTGFFVWRIENMNVIALPKDNYGTFYDAESYIVYASSLAGTPANIDTVCREVKTTPEIHIHFWLGTSSTADKSGVAAYKTVELDGYLGGNAIQHRETQGNESPRFKSYFRSGIRILKGTSSSLGKEIVAKTKMYKVKGSRIPILTQLPSISWSHFNSGDVFIIQTETTIFIWLGRAATSMEKLHSAKIATTLKTETGIGKIAFIEDGYEQTLADEDKCELQKYLPLDKRHVMPLDFDGNDDDKSHKGHLKLYRCSDNNGKYRVTEIKAGPLVQADLDCDDVFIIDNGTNGIWVWVGRRASDKERVEAMRNARGFVKKKKYPNNTNVTRVIDGSECLEFKMLFNYWKDDSNPKTNTVAVGKRAISKFDALTMEERPSLAAETQLVDDGSGQMRIWRIMNDEVVEIAREKHGQFFAGDCYIVWYNYESAINRNIVFYWIGMNASAAEIESVEAKVIEMDEQLEGTGVQIRVRQGKEPAQFLQLFKGKLIIYKGCGTDYDESGRNMKHPANYLLQVEGSSSFSSKAMQVPYKTSSLNSNYCFVLKKGRHYHIWCGNVSTGDQREMAKHFTGKDFEIILEGKETKEFWDILGGKTSYATSKFITDYAYRKPVRLFHCSNKTGVFKAEEIFNFSQSDLIPEDIMLLDAHETIFIWIGKLSGKTSVQNCENIALEYIKTDPSGKDENTAIVILRQHHELPTFTGFFSNWNHKFWKDYKPFEEIRHTIQGGTPRRAKNTTMTPPSDSVFDKYDKYPVSVLKGPSDKLPAKVDPLVKELHLTHDDFVYVFKMQYKEFEVLPRWKQQELKKKVGLF
ncbi:LOW QUALITY PROTEIN: advillin [Atheta coriaria]|uniref:LOW QUALITY PROTEIN: advillin n=1 Tax=Dalotia coriaria TaxID=877792 RepID=UPI0031F45047